MGEEARGHGGARQGAGRPKGSRMRRSDILAEDLIAAGKCPVDALVRLAEKAEIDGDLGQAIGAWKSILPYIYPKPKAIETAPDLLVQLAKDVAAARADATQFSVGGCFVDLVEKYLKESEIATRKEAVS